MSFPEPAFLQVGLSAWVLDHQGAGPAGGGAHPLQPACGYLPTTECDFAAAFATALDAKDEDFRDLPVVKPEQVGFQPPTGTAPWLVNLPLPAGAKVLLRLTATPTKKLTLKSLKNTAPIGQFPVEATESATDVGYYGAVGYFVYQGEGIWQRFDRGRDPDQLAAAFQFAPPSTVSGSAPAPFVYTMISFFLSRVRDRTGTVMDVIRGYDPGREAFVVQKTDFKGLANPPVAGGRLAFRTDPMDLDADCRVLEIKGFKAPATIAVCWPRANDRQPPLAELPALRARPMESLIFFHASNGQNAAIYNRTPYPFGKEQVDHGFDSYLNPSDPLIGAYPLNLPHQIRAAGKRTVLLLPLNRVAWPELPALSFPEQTIELLEEIQAAFLRFAGFYFWAPTVGRIGLACFSAAFQEMARFRRAVDQSPLLRSLVKEIVVFDTKHGNGAEVAANANALKQWAAADPDRRVRNYSSASDPGLETFVGVKMPGTPVVADSADGRFTAAVVTDADWLAANDGVNRMKPARRTDVAVGILAEAAPAGSTGVVVKEAKGFSPGDRFIASRIEVAEIAAVDKNRLIFKLPLAHDHAADSGGYRFGPRSFETALAADALTGATTVTVADPGPCTLNDRFLLGETHYYEVTGIEGPVLTLGRPLDVGASAGTRVSFYEPTIRSVLAADHPAGATTLKVFSGSPRGFRVGQAVMVGAEFTATLTKVTTDTLTINRGLPAGMPRLTEVYFGVPRTLDWGLYHAMFCSVFLQDAMRKSGFA